jgi:hypothetical protein
MNIWKKDLWSNYILKHRLFEGYYSGYAKNKNINLNLFINETQIISFEGSLAKH